MYEKRLKLCFRLLIGRVFLSKGEEPWKLQPLREKLQTIWKLSSLWRLISLGRGFYHILLYSEEEKSHVWGINALSLKPGILWIQSWIWNFNSYIQKTTNAQIWVRFHDLPWEYWDHKILFDLARCMKVPLKFDEMTRKGDYGHFAWILIDVNFSKLLPDSLMLEASEDCLSLDYENLVAILLVMWPRDWKKPSMEICYLKAGLFL